MNIQGVVNPSMLSASQDAWRIPRVRGVLCWAAVTAGVIKFYDASSSIEPCHVAGTVLGRSGRCCLGDGSTSPGCDSTFSIKQALCTHLNSVSPGLDVAAIVERAAREPVIGRVRRSGGVHVVGVMSARLLSGNILKVRIGDPDGSNPIGSIRLNLSKPDTIERLWLNTITTKSAGRRFWWLEECSSVGGEGFGSQDIDLGARGFESSSQWATGQVVEVVRANRDLLEESLGAEFSLRSLDSVHVWGLDFIDIQGLDADTIRERVRLLGWVVPVADRTQGDVAGAGVSLAVGGDALEYAGFYRREFMIALNRASELISDGRREERTIRILRIPEAFLVALWEERSEGRHRFVVLPPVSFSGSDGIRPFVIWNMAQLRDNVAAIMSLASAQPVI